MRFFLRGSNPFKIQTRCKLDFVLESIIENLEKIESWAKKETCSHYYREGHLQRFKIALVAVSEPLQMACY
jgi:hypothetical protein